MLQDQSFKVGDRVFQIRKGIWGTVTHIHSRDKYPVKVEFDNKHSDAYTMTGLEYADDKQPMLVLEEVIITAPKRKFKPTLVGKTVRMEHRHHTNPIVGEITEEDELTIYIEDAGYFRKGYITSLVEVTYGTQNLL